jgi:hypothetical protein
VSRFDPERAAYPHRRATVIKEFSVGCSRTINLGNFESLRVEASVTIEVPETGDLQSLKDAAQVELRALLEDTYRAQHKRSA